MDLMVEIFIDECITKSVVLDKLSKANIELSDIITIILDWIGFISEEDGDYISEMLHKIRDHITLTMGATVGTPEAIMVAEIETKIEQLADEIFKNYSLYVSLNIDIRLWYASENLDLALIWMSTECIDLAKYHIIIAESELETAKNIVLQFKDQGKISEENAQKIIDEIDLLISILINTHTHDQHDEAYTPDDGTQTHTHLNTDENDNPNTSDTNNSSDNTENPNTEIPTH